MVLVYRAVLRLNGKSYGIWDYTIGEGAGNFL